MQTIYGSLTFDEEVVQKNLKRLINQTWKLIPMRENDENWKSQLIINLNELIGLEKIFNNRLNLLIIISKLQGLAETEVEFKEYRKIILGILNTLSEVKNNV